MRSMLKLILIVAVLVVLAMRYNDIKQAFFQAWENPGSRASGSGVLGAVHSVGSATNSVLNHVANGF